MKKAHQEFGKLVHEYRLKKSITQKELANALGYDTAQFVSIIERGVCKIPYKTIGCLIKILSLPEKKVLKLYEQAFENYLREQVKQGKEEMT